MRLFFALTFDPALQQDLAEATRPLRDAVPTLAWVSAERLHLTLKFLGEVSAGDVAGLREAAHTAVQGESRHDASIGGIGAFPNLGRPRVVWMGMHDTAPLVRIAAALDHVSSSFGVPAEARPFRPHVTLARVKTPLSGADGAALTQRAREIRVRVRVSVHEVTLMQSTLGAGGPRYEAVATFPLNGR